MFLSLNTYMLHIHLSLLCGSLLQLLIAVFVLFPSMQEGQGWAMQLLAVACLSLAAKMEETLVPSLLDLQASTVTTCNVIAVCDMS